MSIIHARVDERLIHGQVATIWTRLVNADRIIVVNDKAVKSEMQIGALKLARPQGVKLTIASVRRAMIILKNGKFDDEKVFVLTNNVHDMKELVAAGIEIQRVNIGNVAPHEGAKQIKASVYLDDEDITDVHEMLDSGVNVTAQMVPTESDASITTFLK